MADGVHKTAERQNKMHCLQADIAPSKTRDYRGMGFQSLSSGPHVKLSEVAVARTSRHSKRQWCGGHPRHE